MKTYTIEEAIQWTHDLFKNSNPGQRITYSDLLVMYKKGCRHVQTSLNIHEDGDLVCAYNQDDAYRTMPEGCVIVSLDDAVEMIDEVLAIEYTDPWEEITREEYDEMLEVLPPEAFSGTAFRMMEYTEGVYTAHFIQLGNRYYTAIRKAIPTWMPYFNQLIKQLDEALT